MWTSFRFAVRRSRIRGPPSVGRIIRSRGASTFRDRWTRRSIGILGYCDVGRSELLEIARGFAHPDLYAACDWTRFVVKPFPKSFPVGTRLGFRVRVCPVVRTASVGKNHRRGSEIDAFLARRWANDDLSVSIDREEVYLDWLRARINDGSGARLVDARVRHFALERLTRRTQGTDRRVKSIRRPAVTITGAIDVTDDGSFREFVRRGVGRHRAFGFGMLSLRPARLNTERLEVER